MDDTQLQQLATRLNVDAVFLQKLIGRLQLQKEEDIIRSFNDIKALQADINVPDSELNTVLDFYARQKEQPQAQSLPQIPQATNSAAVAPQQPAAQQTFQEPAPIATGSARPQAAAPQTQQVSPTVQMQAPAQPQPQVAQARPEPQRSGVVQPQAQPVSQGQAQPRPQPAPQAVQPLQPAPTAPQQALGMAQGIATQVGGQKVFNAYNKYGQGYQFRPSDGANDYGGQCAWFAQQVTQLPDGSGWTIGNEDAVKAKRLEQHVNNGNAFYRGQDTPQPGNAIVFSGGVYGHVGVVSEVLPGNKIRVTEANYNNDLKVKHDRIIDANDPNIRGYMRTKPKEGFGFEDQQTAYKKLSEQGVKTNVTTPPEPQLPQNVDPQNPAAQEEANIVNEGLNKALEVQRQATTPAPTPPPNQIPSSSQQNQMNQPTSVVNQAQMDSIINQLPENQREAARNAMPGIASALQKEGILTPRVLAFAVTTAGHESGFVPKEEKMAQRGINARNDYIAGLQENYSGGKDFKGRGYIQLTHDYNYKKYGDRIGEDLVSNPNKLLESGTSAKVLAAYLKDSGAADLAEKGDFINARVRVQGKGALNSEFMPTTQALAEQANKLVSTIGDKVETVAQETEAGPKTDKVAQITASSEVGQQSDIEKTEKGVDRPDAFTTAQQQAGQITGEQKQKNSNTPFLDVFSKGAEKAQQVAGIAETAVGKAIQDTREAYNQQAGANTGMLEQFSKSLAPTIGMAATPEQEAEMQQNLENKKAYFSSAVNKAAQLAQEKKEEYQDPSQRIKNAVQQGATGVAEAAKNLFTGNQSQKFASVVQNAASPQKSDSFASTRQAQANRYVAPQSASARKPVAQSQPARSTSAPAKAASVAKSVAKAVTSSPAKNVAKAITKAAPARAMAQAVSRAPVARPAAQIARAVVKAVSQPSRPSAAKAVSKPAAKVVSVAKKVLSAFRR